MYSDLAHKLRKLRENFGLTDAQIAKELRGHVAGVKLTAEMIREFDACTQQPSVAGSLKGVALPGGESYQREIKPFFDQSN